MKVLIIYFSQTKNTRHIAEYIHTGLQEAGCRAEMKSILEIDIESLSGYDLVGLGSPVFYYKEPFNVSDFLGSLPHLNGQHWFVFCSHGNVIGNFFPSVTQKLQKKDAKIIGCYNSYAEITVPFYPQPSYTSGHPDASDFEKAKSFGRSMVQLHNRINQEAGAPIALNYPVSSHHWITESQRLTRELLGQLLPRLLLDKETCSQCHQCEENCPVQGIDIEAEPPRIQSPCIYCWHCVNLCPTQSIQADWTILEDMAPENYNRYKAELDQASARGEFRWLMDPDTIDFQSPLHKQRKQQLHSKQK